VEDAVRSPRAVTFQDIVKSFGSYFWDVIGVLFILWIPMMVIERGMVANPRGPLITAAVFLVLFIVLNPAPEVIYQVRHDSPLDVIRGSYEFVVENWIEWFLPLTVLAIPLLIAFLNQPTGYVNWVGGLSFSQLLMFPYIVLLSWFSLLGLSQSISWIVILGLTPPLAVMILLFRGHLFAALHGTSRRQRMFRTQGWGE
jgi:hypothetical protein